MRNSLSKDPMKYLVKLETLLRYKSFGSKQKFDAAEQIKAYCTKKNIISYFRKTQKVKFSQPADFYEDPNEWEMLFQMAHAELRRKIGGLVIPEEPIGDEPSTLVYRSRKREKWFPLMISQDRNL